MSKLRRYFLEGTVIAAVPAVVGAIHNMPALAVFIGTTWVWYWTLRFNNCPKRQGEE
jgi:heme A synthase